MKRKIDKPFLQTKEKTVKENESESEISAAGKEGKNLSRAEKREK